MVKTEAVVPSSSSAGAPQSGIWRFVGYQLTTQAVFDSAIWIIYLQSRGYSLGQIGLCESCFHLAPILAELPSGSFADIIGRRWSLAAGAALVILSMGLLWLAPALPVVMLALFLNGASYSFRSGADQAYLFEVVEGRGGDHTHFAGIFGKILGASYLAGAAATWAGAALSEFSYAWPFGLTMLAGLIGVILAASLPERARVTRRISVRKTVQAHVEETRQALRAEPIVLAMLLLSALFWMASTLTHLYMQTRFSSHGISNGGVGIIASVTLVLSAGGAAFAGRLAGHGRFAWQFALIALVAGAGLIGTASLNLTVAISCYLLAQVAYGIVEPLISSWFNRRIPSSQRATILSAESWLFSVMMIGAFPAGGLLAEHAGWGALYVLCGGFTVILGIGSLVLARARRG